MSSEEWRRKMALTRTEAAVVGRLLIAETNEEIGLHLGISEGTVKTHLKNIAKKWHTRNRVHIALIACGVMPS